MPYSWFIRRISAVSLAEKAFFQYFIMKIAQGTYVFDEGF